MAGHLTCVGASRDETLAVAAEYRAMGVNRIVALRGDPPKGEGAFVPHPDGFTSSVELVEALAKDGYDVTVGCYPEIHPEAASADADIEHLKRKLDAGATRAITQFFFEADTFLRFRDRAVKAGIEAEIIPGILPIENFTKMARFARSCGTSIPDWLLGAFQNAEDEAQETLLATAIATELSDTLMREGSKHLHFYTLNKPDLTYEIARAIGCEPARFGMAEAGGAA